VRRGTGWRRRVIPLTAFICFCFFCGQSVRPEPCTGVQGERKQGQLGTLLLFSLDGGRLSCMHHSHRLGPPAGLTWRGRSSRGIIRLLNCSLEKNSTILSHNTWTEAYRKAVKGVTFPSLVTREYLDGNLDLAFGLVALLETYRKPDTRDLEGNMVLLHRYYALGSGIIYHAVVCVYPPPFPPSLSPSRREVPLNVQSMWYSIQKILLEHIPWRFVRREIQFLSSPTRADAQSCHDKDSCVQLPPPSKTNVSSACTRTPLRE